jgi:hypothetical protein
MIYNLLAMKQLSDFFLRCAFLIVVAVGTQSCIYINDLNGDVSPRGVVTREINLSNFDQLSMGSAYSIHVKQGNEFRITVTGELNDVDDLEVTVSRSGVLEIRYRNTWRNRRDRMDIDIVMPDLVAVDFSGASVSTIRGFEDLPSVGLRLSGASKSFFVGLSDRLNLDLSGASELNLEGEGGLLTGTLSGASQLFAFSLPVNEADLNLSGASRARVWATSLLKVDASGASNVRYRGNPTVDQRLSGGSTLTRD